MKIGMQNNPTHFLDQNLRLKENLHHIGYSVPRLDLFPLCIKYWNHDPHGIYMGYILSDFLIEYICPVGNKSLIKSVSSNEAIEVDHFCFSINPSEYPFPLLRVTDKFYSDLWGYDVQFFYDRFNDVKIEFIWL